MSHIRPEPRSAFVSATTERLLDMLPPYEQKSVDIQAALDALAAELDRLDERVQEMLDTFFPGRADAYLRLWEMVLGLAVEADTKTLEQRRTTVLAFMKSWGTASTGRGWKESLTKLIGSAWTYREHSEHLSSPPAGVLEIAIPYTPELPTPTGLVATPGGGGTLGAGTYRYAVAARNFYGETLATAEVTATVAANGTVALDWNDVAGATSYAVYRGTAPGQLFLLAFPAVSAYTDTGTATGATRPPTTNTTESFRAGEARTLARQLTPAHLELQFVFQDAFIVGVSQIGIDDL